MIHYVWVCFHRMQIYELLSVAIFKQHLFKMLIQTNKKALQVH